MWQKRTWGLLVVVCCCITLVGCVKNDVSREFDFDVGTTVEELIGIENVYHEENVEEIIEVETLLCMDSNYPTMRDIAAISDNVIAGTIIDVAYTDDNATAWTYYAVEVDESLKGSIATGDVVVVCQGGGYVRLAVYADVYGDAHFEDTIESVQEGVYLQFAFGGVPMSQKDDRVILCLGEKSTEGRSKGCYVLMRQFMGKYVYNEEEGGYLRYCPEGEEFLLQHQNAEGELITESVLTINEIQAQVNESVVVS